VKHILLPDGSVYAMRFEEDVLFGSLRPVKRGGRKEYYCRECFAEKSNKATSIITLKTPHWTQSMYPDGVEGDSRITTRLCDKHAHEFLLKIIYMVIGEDACVFGMSEFDIATKLINHRGHLRLSAQAIDVAIKEIIDVDETTKTH